MFSSFVRNLENYLSDGGKADDATTTVVTVATRGQCAVATGNRGHIVAIDNEEYDPLLDMNFRYVASMKQLTTSDYNDYNREEKSLSQ